MDWDDLRFFTAVYRGGSLSGAARNLGVSIQTVGRRIAALEAATGASLFVRHANGYRPTADAHTLMEEAGRVEEAMARFRSAAGSQGTEMSGIVRLAAPETLATYILIPGLQPFLARYPYLELEIVTGVATVGIARGEADLALRLVAPEQGSLTRRKIGEMTYGLYAGAAESVDLKTARLVGWTGEIDLPADRWLRRLAGRGPDFRTNHLESHRAAIAAGIGIGVLPCFLADNLIRIPTASKLEEALWLVIHKEAVSGRVRCVYNEVIRIIAAAGGRLAGLHDSEAG